MEDFNIVGFDAEGNPITIKDFITDINIALQQIENDTIETFTCEEVKRRILDSE